MHCGVVNKIAGESSFQKAPTVLFRHHSRHSVLLVCFGCNQPSIHRRERRRIYHIFKTITAHARTATMPVSSSFAEASEELNTNDDASLPSVERTVAAAAAAAVAAPPTTAATQGHVIDATPMTTMTSTTAAATTVDDAPTAVTATATPAAAAAEKDPSFTSSETSPTIQSTALEEPPPQLPAAQSKEEKENDADHASASTDQIDQQEKETKADKEEEETLVVVHDTKPIANPVEPAGVAGVVLPPAEEEEEYTTLVRYPRRSRKAARKAVEAIKEASTPSKTTKTTNTGKRKQDTRTTNDHQALIQQQQREQHKKKLNIGRLVEQNKHVVESGTTAAVGEHYYPHHGTILAHHEQEGRIPPRYVIRWQNPIEAPIVVQQEEEWIDAELAAHDTKLLDGRGCFQAYNPRRPEKSRYGPPMKQAFELIRERYHKLVIRDMDHEEFHPPADNEDDTPAATTMERQTKKKKKKNNADEDEESSEDDDDSDNDDVDDDDDNGGDLLPTLILMAALEDALQTSLHYQLQQEQERQLKEGEEGTATAPVASLSSRSKKARNTHTHPPLYYSSNPNQYLLAPSREADAEDIRHQLEQSRNPKVIVTPAMLAQRIRTGCEWAYTYLQQQQQQQHEEEEDDNNGGTPFKLLAAPAFEKIVAARIDLETVKAKSFELFGKDTTEDTQTASSSSVLLEEDGERRTSVRSAAQTSLFDPSIGRRATRRQNNNISYAEPVEIPEPNPVKKGGRVALWWLKTLDEKRKQHEEEEQEQDDEEDENEDEEKEDTENDGNVVDMEDVGSVNDDSGVGNETEEEATKTDADDEDFTMSKDGENQSDEESLEDVEKEQKHALSSTLGEPKGKKKKKAKKKKKKNDDEMEEEDDDDDEDEEEEEDDEEEEEEDEEDAIIWNNPYLPTSFPAVLEYLSKPKSISGEDIQRAMDQITLRMRKNKRATDNGIPIDTLQSYDRVILDWENPDHPAQGNLVLKCVSGETVQELQRLDSGTFGRCKFELDVIGQKEKTVQIRQKEDFEQRDTEYKARKAEDKWRFKGIHEGYAVWPSWQDAATKWIQENASVAAATGNSTADDTIATDAIVPAATNSTSSNITTNDEDLARCLEENEMTDTGAGRRRGGRRRTANSGKEGVFYGNQSSLTQRQLLDALVRLVKANTFQTMIKLQSMVGDDSADPLRRCRIALGKIIWKRNLLARQAVSSDDSDRLLLQELIAGNQILQFRPSLPAIENTVTSTAVATTTDSKKIGDETKKEIPEEANDLLVYISHLHKTELELRSLVLKQLEVVPLPILATAADERLGSLENMDALDFDDPSTIDWKSTGNELLNKRIFRPSVESTMGTESTPCRWYQIQDYSESIKSEAEDAEADAMERRMRFRAAPITGPSGGQDKHGGDVLILTEGQVHAGMKAAKFHERQSSPVSTTTNPFANEIGVRVTLVPIEDGELTTELSVRVVGHDFMLDPDNPSGDAEYRILILPDFEIESSESSQKDPFWAMLDVRADNNSPICQPEGQSIWYSIESQDFHQDSEPYKECEKVLDWLSRQSKAGPFMHPVDPVALGIPTYPDIVKNPMDISTVGTRLESGLYSKIGPGQTIGNSATARMLNGPFRADIELIFDNAALFNPPDDWIAMSAAALKKSIAKKIDSASWSAEKSHNKTGGRSSRNSMYIDEDSDVDMYVDESDYDDDHASSRRGRNKRKRSNAKDSANFKDEAAARPLENVIRLQNCLKDGNDLRGRFSTLPVNSYASTYSMPNGWSCRKATTATEIGDITATTELSKSDIDNEMDVSSDNADDNNTDSPTSQKKQEYMQEMADLLAIQREVGDDEAASLRRSSRATTSASRSTRSSKKKDSSSKTEGLEYFLRQTPTLPTKEESIDGKHDNDNNIEDNGTGNSEKVLSSIPSSRLDVEILQEKRHEEYYSKLYQRYEKELLSCYDNKKDLDNKSGKVEQFGAYAGSSFPPYLGTVTKCKNSHGCLWEIRPPFAVPALRWVLRGLVHSGHLTDTEPMTGNSAESSRSNIDTNAGSIVTNDVYYHDDKVKPFEVLDIRELKRKKNANKSGNDPDSDEDFEMSEYEKLRAERVARNAERLKALGLA